MSTSGNKTFPFILLEAVSRIASGSSEHIMTSEHLRINETEQFVVFPEFKTFYYINNFVKMATKLDPSIYTYRTTVIKSCVRMCKVKFSCDTQLTEYENFVCLWVVICRLVIKFQRCGCL